MKQYILKSAVLAEIERLKEVQPLDAFQPKEQNKMDWMAGKLFTITILETFIDTLEVKEVDLKEEVERFAKECGYKSAATIDFQFAKHFFELGMAVSNKVQTDNIRHFMDEPPKYPCDILLVTDVDNIFLCRYMENGRPVDRETPYFHNIENGKCWYYCNDIMNIH